MSRRQPAAGAEPGAAARLQARPTSPSPSSPSPRSFIAVQVVLPNKWFAMQGLDAEEFDSEKAPLMMEGAPPSLMLFVLLWVTSFTIAHGG